ncbi:MAG TPA: carbohydrate ABC transporter permease [Spirochaetia bacterium]
MGARPERGLGAPVGRIAGGFFRYLLVVALGLVVLVPILWMVSSSFMRHTEFFAVPTHWLPDQPNLDAYRKIVVEQPFGRYYLNSIVIAVVVSLSNVLLAALTGFAVSNKYSYRGKNAVFAFFLGTMLLPFELIMIPLYIMMRTLGLLNTYAAMIIPGLVSAFGVFLLRQTINDIPQDFLDAGRIDGAHEITLFARVIVPLSMPVMAALLVFTFVGSWNSYFWPLVVVNSERLRTLTLAVAYMQGFYSTDYPLVMAAAVLSSVPIMLVFAFSQRFFIESMTLSGLKG